ERGGARVDHQPGQHRPQPASGPSGGPRAPRRAADRPRPGARRSVVPDPAGRARRARVAGVGRAGRLAEDFRLARHPHRGPDPAGGLEALLELSARDEAAGLGDAPWPPNYRKQEGEPPRVQPSKQRRADAEYNTPEAEAERQKSRAAMERRFAPAGEQRAPFT